MKEIGPVLISVALLSTTGISSSRAQSPADAKAAMKSAATFYKDKIARNGGYVYYTAPDFSWRHGEGPASDSQIWVQPPGTPTVGLAYLAALEATLDPFYLIAAVEAGNALIHGQLQSGAWTNSIDFDPKTAQRYRNGKGNPKGRNFSTLDDEISQEAIRFMVMLDQATNFENQPIHESATVALDALLEAQFPNGAFPQGWDETPANPGPNSAGKKANYPDYDWRTEGRIKEYWDYYTLNDDLAPAVTNTLITAYEVYEDEKYLNALKKLGDFLILAQMPEPQPGWAQQYNYDMQPIWARKFEPAALSGRESEGIVATLMRIAVYTKDKKYLEPIPKALAWLKKSELPGGKLARYYELENNKPLYMSRNGKTYSLTNDDSNLPSHYGWKNEFHVSNLEAAYAAIFDREPLPDPIIPASQSEPTVGQILQMLTPEGAWISEYNGEPLVGQPKFQPGDRFIDSAVFSRNLQRLATFVKEQTR